MKLSDITEFVGVTDKKEVKPIEPETTKFNRENMGVKEVYLSWEEAPKAVSTSIDPKFKRAFLIVGIVIAFLLFVMKEYMLLLVIGSIAFLTQVFSKNPIPPLKYEISSHGLFVNDRLYYWDELTRFFFTGHYGVEMLAVDTKEGLPPRLFIAFRPKDKEKIIGILNKYIAYIEKEPITVMDKMYKSVLNKFDFENKQ